MASEPGVRMTPSVSAPPLLRFAPEATPIEARRVAAPWLARLLDTLRAYLPMLLMAMLALGTWWLVKNTPLFETGKPLAPLRHEPDYTMQQFLVQRFAADGALRVQIEGEVLRHFPDTDSIEVEQPRIRAFTPDGRVTVATAQRALSNGDGTELELSGGAYVVSRPAMQAEPIEFRGEFLHVFVATERVRSHLPVAVTQGASELHADSMAYDNKARVVELGGRVRAVFMPLKRPSK